MLFVESIFRSLISLCSHRMPYFRAASEYFSKTVRNSLKKATSTSVRLLFPLPWAPPEACYRKRCVVSRTLPLGAL